MMGTSADLTPQENIVVINFMENQSLAIARQRHFLGIMTTNTSALTQQLATHVYGYETLLDYQINQYVCKDGFKPFGRAPDNQRALVQWKVV